MPEDVLLERTRCLEALLSSFQINLEVWGKGEARTVHELHKKVLEGESCLRIDTGGITRVLRIVKMMIRDPEKGYLVVDHLFMADGRKKESGKSPAGKVKAAENPEEALVREMMEELQLEEDGYEFEPDETREEERPSKSYPGLRSVYEVCRFWVFLKIPIPDGYSIKDEAGQTLVFRWVNVPK